jgi:hypothetical protein
MKKFLVPASIAALSAVSLHAQTTATTYAPDITAMDASKIWAVSGTLRGFYDSNYNTSHISQGSWGFEFSPSLSLLVPLQQTEIGLKYTYGLYYYAYRAHQNSNPIDQSHEADLWIDHAFTERVQGKVQDTFTYSQEPQLASTPTALPYRTQDNSIQNLGTVSLHNEWTGLFSTDLSYANTLVQYANSGTTEAGLLAAAGLGPGAPQTASLAGYLNMIGQTISLNLNYQFRPDLSFLVGYQFGLNRYTANEPIGIIFVHGAPLMPFRFYNSSNLDSYSNYGYAGGNYQISGNLQASLAAGIQYIDNYDLPSGISQDETSLEPYVNLAITYTYLPGDYIQGGFTEQASTSNSPNPNQSTGSLTTYQQTSVLYASLNHQITPFLLGSLIGRWQDGIYHGGASDGESQMWYSFGFNLSYSFTQHWSADLGYNFDYVTAAAGLQSYNRSRVYLGATAAF